MGNLLETALRVQREQRARAAREERGGGNGAEGVGSLRLSEFARSQRVLAVRVAALGGAVVCLAADEAPLADCDAGGRCQGRVVYRAREWGELYRLRAGGLLDDAGLRLIHEAKETFGGELLAPEDPLPSGASADV